MLHNIFHSFLGERVKYKMTIAFSLLSILPLLIFIFTLQESHVLIDDIKIPSFYFVFLFIFLGFFILLKISDNIWRLKEMIKLSYERKHSGGITFSAEQELVEIADHFNRLQNDLSDFSAKLEHSYQQSIAFAKDLINVYRTSMEEGNLRNKLQQYIDPDQVAKVLEGETDIIAGAEQREVTTLFAGLSSFNSFYEEMGAKEARALLNEFYALIHKITSSFGGSFDKFLGDSVMTVFGAPFPAHDDAVRAIKASLEIQKEIVHLGKKTGIKLPREPVQVGIGIDTGLTVAGVFGIQHYMDYTVIGNSVTNASRLQEKAEGGQILIGENTCEKVKSLFPLSMAGEFMDRGCDKKVRYFLLGKQE